MRSYAYNPKHLKATKVHCNDVTIFCAENIMSSEKAGSGNTSLCVKITKDGNLCSSKSFTGIRRPILQLSGFLLKRC